MAVTITGYSPEELSETDVDEGWVTETEHWIVLLRKKQITLPSLLLLPRTRRSGFADLASSETNSLPPACKRIETVLETCFDAQRCNYFVLMMKERWFHIHVIPRYDRSPAHLLIEFPDRGWPGAPDLRPVELPDQTWISIRNCVRGAFSDYSDP